MRWAYELNDFSFDIIHKPDKEQVQLDALSHRKQDIPCDVDDDRIANRHHQLLEGDTESLKVVAKATWIRDGDADSDKELMNDDTTSNMRVCGERHDCSLGCCTSSQSSILEDPKGGYEW